MDDHVTPGTDLRDEMRRRGIPLTIQRRAVLAVLRESQDEHLTAEEIRARAKERGSDLGAATVYRALDLFERLGVARRIAVDSRSCRYELKRPGHAVPHHFVCLSCGRIIEGEPLSQEDLLAHLPRGPSLSVTSSSVQTFGYCEDCAKAGRAKRRRET